MLVHKNNLSSPDDTNLDLIKHNSKNSQWVRQTVESANKQEMNNQPF